MTPRASADQISDLRAQASALASRIQSLGLQEDALAEQYDAAQLAVQQLQVKVSQAAQQVASAQATAAKDRSSLRQEVVDAYLNGGTDPLTQASSASGALVSATDSVLRAEYVDTLATTQNDSIDQYHLAALQYRAAESNLQSQTRAVQAEANQVQQDRQAVAGTQVQLQATLNQDTGQIAVLVAQQQAAERAAAEAAAQQAAQQRAAEAAAAAAAAQQAQQAQQAAAAQATASVQATPAAASVPPAMGPPPPPGHGASGAVAAALSRVGDPYVYGAAGPNSFDCSGLVMWSYEQVGVSLPHFSGAQYADTTHIPMSDLQPGDLVFPSDPAQHVAMYIGNGEVVQAPYTGADVQVIPLSSFFQLASRVE